MIKTEKDALYYYNKIEPLKKQGLWWQIVDIYEKVVSLIFQPKRELLLEYIFYLKKMYRFEEVVKVYRQVEVIAPLTSDEAFDYAYALEKSGEEELSHQFYQQAIELDTNKNAKLFGKSVFYEAIGDWSGASKAYRESFKDKELSLQMAYKQGLAYDRCYQWEEAEKIYLDAILKSDKEVNFYHRLGIVQERQKKYEDAIESYLVAVIKHKQHLSYFYYRLGYLLQKIEHYKEACEAFLMMKKMTLPKVENNIKLIKKNGVILHQYLLDNEPLTLDGWLKFANRAETLRCWKVATYAHKEYLARKENFNGDDYFNLAQTLVYQGEYKEASKAFLEQRVIQDAHGLVETEYHKNRELQKRINYTEYYERFELDDNLILYEGYRDINGYSFVEDIFLSLQNNIQFDHHRHIWVVNRLEEFSHNIRESQFVIFISRDSDLYMRYLARAKYIIHNTPLANYFIQKETQICFNSYDRDKITLDSVIKSIFFKTQINQRLNEYEKKSILIYGGSFLPNGITVALLNLMEKIDREKYDITLVIDKDVIFSKLKNIEQFNRLNLDNLRIIEKKSEMLTTLEEKWVIVKFNMQHDLVSKEMWSILNGAYQREFKRVFGSLEFDFIINFEGYSQYWNRVLGSINHIPKVLYLHNDMLAEAQVKYSYLYGNFKIYKNYDKIISVSKDSYLINKNSLNIDSDKFEYALNPLNIQDILMKSKFDVESQDKFLFENSQVFINIARLSPEKGHIKLIRAFHKLSKYKNNIKLLILGQGLLKDKLQELIVTLSLENKVFLLGHKFNPMSYLKASDCFVLSSNHEGQGLVILEAMVLKKYVISTDIDGPRELLKDNLGDLVENSEDGLYLGMLAFLEKPSIFNDFDVKKYNQEAISMFNNKVLTLINKPKGGLNQLYQSAINDFNNQNWKDSFHKFSKIKNESSTYSTKYYIRESRVRDLIENENKNINNILIYVNHKFDSENFAGLLLSLSLAKENSLYNSHLWESLYLACLPIVEYVKDIDGTLDDFLDKNFLIKANEISIKFINSLESNLLSYQIWFVFANLFILTRNYKQYQLARTKALESVTLTKRIPKVGFARYKINAMAELSQELDYDLLRAKLLKRDEQYLKQHLLLLGNTELYFNRQQSVANFYKKQYTSREKIFANYIQGKSIAIVGPVDSGLNLGEEIDSYDVVLRFNYMGMRSFSTSSFGEKTDISFYISQLLLQNHIDTKTIIFMNQLQWIIVDTEHQESDVCLTGLNRPVRQRFYAGHPHINPFFKGTPSGIQRAIMDLLRFDIGKLKVFNTNLFLQNNYAEAYKSHGKSGIDYFNFIRHDPLSNFIFLKRLNKFKIVETDNVLNRVLQMSEEQYIEVLEAQYGYKK